MPASKAPKRRTATSSSGLLARCSFPPAGSVVDLAVSGGPDSLALLVLAAEAGLEATAWHVDHGLRTGSAEEADVVRDVAARFGVGFRSVSVEIGAGPNLEARARVARFAALPAGVLTGHTADDQAETVLLNLLRGAGADGLAGMRPGPTKPLLALRRHETAEVCRASALHPVDDPSNADPSIRRNRVRHELMPLLDDIAERDVVAVVAASAAVLRDDVELLDALAAEAVPDPTDAHALNAAPLPLARRAVRRWLSTEHPPDLATVERVLAVARCEARSTDVGGGRRVVRSGMRLSLQ